MATTYALKHVQKQWWLAMGALHLGTQRHTWYKKITAFQNCLDTIDSCAMECCVPVIEHIQGKSSVVDPKNIRNVRKM